MSGVQRVAVLFALPVVGHPRDSKRIAMLQSVGFTVEAIAFERRFHKGRAPTCPVTVVGKVEHGRYLKRLGALVRAIPAIRKKLRTNQLVYASGVDMAFVCLLANCWIHRPVVLEIGDIREIQTSKGFKGWIVRKIDKWVADRCALLVATAEDFIQVYYRRWVGTQTPSMVIENKLDIAPQAVPVVRSTQRSDGQLRRPLRIGYFGVLRWRESWEMLRALAEAEKSRFEVIVAGHILEPADLAEQAARCPNVRYLGEYSWPDGLTHLYNSVDLIWAVRPEVGTDWNHRWARTNRFYEGCFFRTPILSRAGCKDAEEVRRLNIGLVIESSDVAYLAQQLRQVTLRDLEEWKSNMAKLPLTAYVHTDEAEKLGRTLSKMLPLDT